MITFMMHGALVSRLATDISVSHLRELQRFAEVGRVSASLIHDMSSPLTAAILHLEQDEPQALSSVRHARRSIRVLERYIEAARRQLRQQDSVSLFDLKHEAIQARHILTPIARQRGIDVRFRVSADGPLKGDPVKFQRIITNLATNAMDAYQGHGTVGPALIRITITGGHDSILIRVRDRGKGMDRDQMDRLFEPFYTTKRPEGAHGTGIGLYCVKRYVEDDFGGHVSVVSSPGHGTEVKVGLPRAEP